MELEEIEEILEKIWDLHDKISDAILAISRSHFLNSIKAQKKSDDFLFSCNVDRRKPRNGSVDDRSGFVFVKDISVNNDAALAEVKSFNSIRNALENLEEQLEFFHTIQSQQQTERDAAIARLEQSRNILAMRLSDHRGPKCKVIEEALAFVGDVENTGSFVSPEYWSRQPKSQSGESLGVQVGKRPNIVMQVLLSGFTFAKRTLKSEMMGGLLGNAALFTVSMLAFLHVHQVAFKNNILVEVPKIGENSLHNMGKKNSSQLESSSLSGHVKGLEVLSARG